MRHAARVDANQAEIVQALRTAGAYVWIIGLPVDLLVGYRGRTVLMECKTLIGKRAPKAADHTDLQTSFMGAWTGGTVATVTDARGALTVIQAMAAV